MIYKKKSNTEPSKLLSNYSTISMAKIYSSLISNRTYDFPAKMTLSEQECKSGFRETYLEQLSITELQHQPSKKETTGTLLDLKFCLFQMRFVT